MSKRVSSSISGQVQRYCLPGLISAVGEDDESHGLSFATGKDGDAFYTVVQNAVKDLIAIEHQLQEAAALEAPA